MITGIDQRVEKSENRFLAAITEFKSELTVEINAVSGHLDSLKTLITYNSARTTGICSLRKRALPFEGKSIIVVERISDSTRRRTP